ncbi:hypothetical protein RugamoR57_44670 [Duganella caerulea]|uniref:LamG-like jellyroll fold domain-containing protein n=1 Tax=Duganella caerulea TaxID=2885762 RepID=UPI0030E80B7E
MTHTKTPFSPERRTFCAGTFGLIAFGPLGLSGCGGGDASAASAQAGSRLLAGTMVSASGDFVHPGLLHTQADFDRMSQKVGAKASPWIDDWNLLLQNNLASNTWKPSPRVVVYRNDGVHGDNVQYLQWDIMAAYLNALQWKITGNIAAANTAVAILNAWGSTLTEIHTTDGHWDGFLAAGLQGYEFANVAEIMRGYSGWAAADIATFQQMMLTVFYPMVQGEDANLQVFSNWGLCGYAAAMAIAVLCDDRAKFDKAVSYFKAGLSNGAIAQMVYYVHPGYLGQTQEAGRDQGHNTLSVALVAALCEMAWNQGVDLYGYDNNRVLAGCEYVAKGNLIESGTSYYTVPFAPYAVRGFSVTTFSTGAQGLQRPTWALIYNHYVNRMGLAAPYSQLFVQRMGLEGGGHYPQTGGTWDQLGYGTLLYTRDPIAAGAPPSGLGAVTTAGQIVLSWWGSAYATSYTVKRAKSPAGPYVVVATGISDLLTHTDTNLVDGTYYYVVTANTPSGETAASNVAVAIAGVKLHTLLKFDEGAGATAADASGHGHAATLADGAAWAAGRTGQASALVLNGSGAHASLPANIVDTVGDFTIAAWVYWNGGQTWARIFDFGCNTEHYMFLSPRTGRGTMGFVASLNGGDGEFRLDAPAALPAAQWVHVAVTLRGTDCALYLNGAQVQSAGGMIIPPFQIGHTTQNWLGRSQFAADTTFNGMIDDFRIYNGAMDAAGIAALSSSAPSVVMFDIDTDVGAVGLPGGVSVDNGVWTVTGSGADMWATEDGFHFAASLRKGDCAITARVASQANTNAWAKSGVMMRANLDANAAHVTMTITPGHGAQMVYRGANGYASTQIGSTVACTAPYWVRLTRVGTVFTGSISPDGVNWRVVGSVSLNLPAALFTGLEVLSHDNRLLNSSTFDNLSFA